MKKLLLSLCVLSIISAQQTYTYSQMNILVVDSTLMSGGASVGMFTLCAALSNPELVEMLKDSKIVDLIKASGAFAASYASLLFSFSAYMTALQEFGAYSATNNKNFLKNAEKHEMQAKITFPIGIAFFLAGAYCTAQAVLK
jgi:hypothetical protein